MTASYGAHEVLELHEVLSEAINGINTMQLYRPHVKDQQLSTILDKQLQFAVKEYNTLVQAVGNKGMQGAIPYRAPKITTTPTYGLHQPGPFTPNMSVAEVDDRDAASVALCIHKASAAKKMLASLECADSQLRHTLQQSAVNCSEQAYEVWQYMNQQGYYQVPTMKEMTTQTMLNSYQPMTMTQAPYGYQTSYQGTGYMNPSTIVSHVQQPSYAQAVLATHTPSTATSPVQGLSSTQDQSLSHVTSAYQNPNEPLASQVRNAVQKNSNQ